MSYIKLCEKAIFNEIAEAYLNFDVDNTPIRKYSEQFTSINHCMPLDGASVLDVACSDGYFCRLLKSRGASKVTGLDLSPRMIEIAQSLTPNDGINYIVGNVLEVQDYGKFDLIHSSYALNYAKDASELQSMCVKLHRHLNPGGRIVSFNDHPDLTPDDEDAFKKYGISKRRSGPARDGEPLWITWHTKDDQSGTTQSIPFLGRYFTKATIERCLRNAGFTDIEMHPGEVSPEGMNALGASYWNLMLRKPLYAMFCARRP